MADASSTSPDYRIDAPNVLRNLLLFGGLCLVVATFTPSVVHLGPVALRMRSFFWPAGFLIGEGLLFLLYVKVGKFHHRDRMLALYGWRGDEQVLDVGCGRGLLLIGAAKRLASGHATGIDIWSRVDLGGNSIEATQHNLFLEGVADRCTLLSEGAQKMSFPDANFDLVLSNLCLHNIYDRPTRQQALAEIARVLKLGGTAILSDYKLTQEYASQLREARFEVERKPANWLSTFPALSIVVARKP
jgi:arsenite methyltransferase